MEINAGIPDNYCQGEAAHLEPIDIEETEFPPEDKVKRIRSIKVVRDKNK